MTAYEYLSEQIIDLQNKKFFVKNENGSVFIHNMNCDCTFCNLEKVWRAQLNIMPEHTEQQKSWSDFTKSASKK